MDKEFIQGITFIMMQTETIVNKMADPLDMLIELQEAHPELKKSEIFQTIMKKRQEALDFIDQASDAMDKMNSDMFEELDIDELDDDEDIFIN